MDYSKFLDDNFDVKEWVNTAFSSQKDPAVNKDQYATTLVMKLQMFIQEVNNVIEESSQQAVQNLPRVMRELDAVKQESSLLQDQMKMVKQDIQKVEQDTSQSMQMLLQLDSIKSRLTAAAEGLQEADNWTTLSADVEEVFQSNDTDAITTKLARMQTCLQMLVDTPDYVERCGHLETLKNRLEAMLSPQLVAAFNSQSIEAAQKFTRIFADIDRLPALYKYYHKCHKTNLMTSWTTVMEAKTEGSLTDWMSEYYDLLLTTWHNQIKWCSQVFADPVPIVCDLITEALSSIDLASSISKHLSQRRDNLVALTELKEISERFSKSIEQSVETHAKVEKLEHTRSLEKLMMMIYAPYRPYIAKYKSMEEATLGSDLNNVRLDDAEVFETVQLLAASVNKLFNIAKEANERCQRLSNGCGYEFLLDALKTYFISYCREFRRVMVNIKEKCKGSHKQDAEDWTLFQQSLRIIQTCGDLIMHVDELDGNIISSIMHTIAHYSNPGSPVKEVGKIRLAGKRSVLHAQASLFLSSSEDIANLENLVSKLEEGETPSVLTDIKKEFCRLSEEVHRFSFDIVFAQLKDYLIDLANMEIWMSKSAGGALTSDLPTFSLSPQEYITKIGQYMMTLPQHLEPFTMQDNPAVIVALKHGKLPYTDEMELPEHTADLWLESIAHGTMHFYCEEILKIHELTTHATKQLTTDIDYLCNVLDDLGLHMSETLKNIDTLLKTSTEDYHDVTENMPQRLAHAISSMRRIDL
ncbi:conserved oligomeric Golgi complex subunit 7-like [Mizuhopecten yessoensis]|uniref:conserved oligomeric Golgi complex subunit 7-like n=1 Tax=Mizuhopecten yessoensis TaxID=6573 RepID=UPI000B45BFFF|nr:conserved oligomeric Golgi complex subunit 7-like [Mizuhopecten yessoensis]